MGLLQRFWIAFFPGGRSGFKAFQNRPSRFLHFCVSQLARVPAPLKDDSGFHHEKPAFSALLAPASLAS